MAIQLKVTIAGATPTDLYANVEKPSKVELYNEGPDTVWLGNSAVLAADGFPLFNGDFREDESSSKETNFGTCAVAETATIRILYDVDTPDAD